VTTTMIFALWPLLMAGLALLPVFEVDGFIWL
jgi:hypothetical protein